MYPCARSGIDYRPTPSSVLGIGDLNLISIFVRCGEFHGAAYTWTTVSAGMAILVVSGSSATDEAGKNSMDDGVAIRIGARLDTSVTDIGLAIEIELLAKKIAGFVGGVCDGEWECDIAEARTRDVGYTP
jgi:hypothetical protein